MQDPIVAGAQDAAKELGYDITSSTVQHRQDEYTGYSFALDAPDGEEVSVELLVSGVLVLRSGLTPRDYARHEVLDALREPDA